MESYISSDGHLVDFRELRALLYTILCRLDCFSALRSIEFHRVNFHWLDIRELGDAVAGKNLHCTFVDCRATKEAARACLVPPVLPRLQIRSVFLRETGKDRWRLQDQWPILLDCMTIVGALDDEAVEDLAIDLGPRVNQCTRNVVLRKVYAMKRLRRLAVSSWNMIMVEPLPGPAFPSLVCLCVGDADVPSQRVHEFEGWWGHEDDRASPLQSYWGPLSLNVQAERRTRWYMQGFGNLPWAADGR